MKTVPAARMIVCEKQSRFGPALCAALRGTKGQQTPQVVQRRSLVQCEAALDESPASLVAVEVNDGNLPAVLDLLIRLGRRRPQARFVALLALDVLEGDQAAMGAALREAGAIDVIASVRDAPRLARLARHLHALAPPEQLSFRESVWRRLPWATHATTG